VGVSDPLIQTSLLGEAIEHAPVVVLVADEQGDLVAVNQSACALLGYERGELLTLRVGHVARNAAPVPDGTGIKRTTLTRKDGTNVEFAYETRETTVAGMPVFVYVGR
jgi:PAS domain S-box-containing protein